MPPLRIAILGAGPAGLTLARLLQLQTKPEQATITIYERDTGIDSRNQGGTLDLHPETGQYALKKAGLLEEFLKVARKEVAEMRVYDGTDGRLNFLLPASLEGSGQDRPEIDRVILRRMLVNSLQPDTIQWGHRISDITSQSHGGPGPYSINFSSPHDLSPVTADLVIGADGAFSKLRHLLTPIKPVYSGICMFDLMIPNADQTHPLVSQLTGEGLSFFLGGHKAIISQRNSRGVIRVYVSFRKEQGWIFGETFEGWEKDKEELMRKVEGCLDGYDEKMMQFVQAADPESIMPREIFAIPTDKYTFESKPGLTLLGDAAHLMSPFAGEGVNLAMADSADLADSITAYFSNLKGETRTNYGLLDDALNVFKMKMFKRAKPAGEESERNGMIAFGDNAVKNMRDRKSVV